MKVTLDVYEETMDEIVVQSLLDALDTKNMWGKEEEMINLEQSIKDVLSFYGKEV